MDVTTVIVNYQTPDYLKLAVSSFKKHYPYNEILIIDNGSRDESKEMIYQLINSFENVRAEMLPDNIYHGQPTLFNFKETTDKGYVLKEFPISEYIDHKWRGTAEKFGYGLCWRSKLDYLLNKIGI